MKKRDIWKPIDADIHNIKDKQLKRLELKPFTTHRICFNKYRKEEK